MSDVLVVKCSNFTILKNILFGERKWICKKRGGALPGIGWGSWVGQSVSKRSKGNVLKSISKIIIHILRVKMPPKKRKTWTEENMVAAMEAVRNGDSVRKAAADWNVPKSTLGDRISGRTEHGALSGPERMLSAEDEKKLASYLIDVSKQGYGKSKEIILYMATQIAVKRGKKVEGCLSEMWWRHFLKRNPEISMRATQNFGIVRTLVTRTTIEQFYERLYETLTDNPYGSLLEKPHLIFNCDESGFEFDSINKTVAAARGAKHIPRVSKGQHEKVTVLACSSAAGNSLPPMLIYKSQSGRVPNGVQEGAPTNTLFTAQKSGWIDKDLYLKWFNELFLKHIPEERPVLLLVDGHKAHVTQDVIETAIRNKILVFCLPAHSSHLLQPLDLSLFGPLKRGWVRACAAFNHIASMVVNQRNFAKIFNVAWHSSNTPQVIRGGFRRAGIYPFDPTQFDYSKLAPTIGSSSRDAIRNSDPPTSESSPPTEDDTVGQDGFATEPASPCMELPLMHEVDVPITPPRPSLLQGDPFLSSTPSGPSTPSTQSNSPGISAAYETLTSLEKRIGRTERERFRRRFQNGYDIDGDHQYDTWRELSRDIGGDKVNANCPCQSACHCTCDGFGFCDCLQMGCPLLPTMLSVPPAATSPVNVSQSAEVPVFPSPPSSEPSPYSTSTPLAPAATSPVNMSQSDEVRVFPSPPSSAEPSPYTISTPSGSVHIDGDLCSIMLDPRRKTTANRKRGNNALNPSNSCITGQLFVAALQSENERKEKEKKEKEEKRKERERTAAEKKKKAEERKEKMKAKAEEKKRKEEAKEAQKKNRGKKGKNGSRAKRKKTATAEEKEKYHCAKCGKEYYTEEENPWVECDYCGGWFHFQCANLPVLDSFNTLVDYTCEECEVRGFPSHNDY